MPAQDASDKKLRTLDKNIQELTTRVDAPAKETAEKQMDTQSAANGAMVQ